MSAKGSGQRTLSSSRAKVWAIIITVCTQSVCVLSYSLSQSSEETREFGQTFLQDRTVQVYIISIPSAPHYFHWRDKKRGGEGDAIVMAVVLITPHSSLAIKLKGDSVWEWKWLSQQKRSSPFISAFISRLGLKAAAACGNLSKYLLWSWINLPKAIQCNYEHLNIATLSVTMRPWAAAVMSSLTFPLTITVWMPKQWVHAGAIFCSQWNYTREQEV